MSELTPCVRCDRIPLPGLETDLYELHTAIHAITRTLTAPLHRLLERVRS